MGNDGVKALAKGLSSSKSILNLDLSHCGFTDAGIKSLAYDLLARNHTVRRLQLRGISIGKAGANALENVLREVNFGIRQIDLDPNLANGIDQQRLLRIQNIPSDPHIRQCGENFRGAVAKDPAHVRPNELVDDLVSVNVRLTWIYELLRSRTSVLPAMQLPPADVPLQPPSKRRKVSKEQNAQS